MVPVGQYSQHTPGCSPALTDQSKQATASQTEPDAGLAELASGLSGSTISKELCSRLCLAKPHASSRTSLSRTTMPC